MRIATIVSALVLVAVQGTAAQAADSPVDCRSACLTSTRMCKTAAEVKVRTKRAECRHTATMSRLGCTTDKVEGQRDCLARSGGSTSDCANEVRQSFHECIGTIRPAFMECSAAANAVRGDDLEDCKIKGEECLVPCQ